jgi:DNA mismatch repair ATPase MutS
MLLSESGGSSYTPRGVVRSFWGCVSLDTAIAVASFRADAGQWTHPQFADPHAPAIFRNLVHPLLENPVPNSLTLAPPHGLLITGSNMSGKSTLLRTLGVNVVLAQTINTSLAEMYKAPVYQVRTCIGRADDLLAGKSYYLVEVESVLALVRARENSAPHLFMFDELFRGTNAVERIAAAEAVLTTLIDTDNPHVTIAATHDGELVDLLRDTYEVCHFGDALGTEGLVFSYRLTSGPATSRNAIALLQLTGAPECVVLRALKRAAELDQRRANSLQMGSPNSFRFGVREV